MNTRPVYYNVDLISFHDKRSVVAPCREINHWFYTSFLPLSHIDSLLRSLWQTILSEEFLSKEEAVEEFRALEQAQRTSCENHMSDHGPVDGRFHEELVITSFNCVFGRA